MSSPSAACTQVKPSSHYFHLRPTQPIEFREGEDMAATLKMHKKAEASGLKAYKNAQAEHKKLYAEVQSLEKKIDQVCG